MRKKRISETMQNINPKFVDEANEYTGVAKAIRRPIWMKWGAIAACLCLIIAAAFAVPSLFSNSNQIATLDNGTEIKFVKTDGAVAQFDIAFQISTKDLTDDEIKELFSDLPVTGYVLFNEEDGSILGIEGKYGDMKLLISAPGINIRDAVIDGEETASDVDGVSVNAGYFTSGKTIIYYATFKLGENTVYVENAGNKDESENVKNEIVSAIQNIVLLEELNINQIAK